MSHYDKLPMWTKPKIEWKPFLIFTVIAIVAVIGIWWLL